MLIKIYRISVIDCIANENLLWCKESHNVLNFEYCFVELTFISNIVFVFRCIVKA